jgi:Terminase small subunit
MSDRRKYFATSIPDARYSLRGSGKRYRRPIGPCLGWHPKALLLAQRRTERRDHGAGGAREGREVRKGPRAVDLDQGNVMTQRKAPARRKGRRRASEKLNAAQEAFCQHYALNKCGSEAVRHAYPHWKQKANQAAAVRASQMLTLRKIRERVTQLETRVAEKLERRFGITTESVLQRVAGVGFSSLADFAVRDENGNLSIDISKADNVALHGLAGVDIERLPGKDGEGPSVSKLKLRLRDPVPALRLLGQHLGMWKGENETTVNVNLSERLRRALARKRA